MNENLNTTSDLPPACTAAMEALLAGGAVQGNEGQAAQQHLSTCARCQAIMDQAGELSGTVKKEISNGLTSRFLDGVMAKVAQGVQPVNNPATSMRPAAASTLKVYGGSPAPRWSWTLPAAAALVLLVAGFTIISFVGMKRSTSALALKSGTLVDDHGNRINELKSGQQYTARDRSVVAVRENALLRVEAGTAFQLNGESADSVSLKSGDMYAATQDGPQPLRVSLNAFDTDLNGGEYFVAQEVGPGPGVVIVFSGLAQVLRGNLDPMPLNAGQIYFSNGGAADGTVAVDEVNKARPKPTLDLEMRTVYVDRVAGFERELVGLKKELAAQGNDSPRARDLQDRTRRVEEYLQQHRERLQAMSEERGPDIPLQQIRRGLSGRTDPAMWKM